ncbi:MAG: cyclase family protein [Solirubrobacteraceae bacterium]
MSDANTDNWGRWGADDEAGAANLLTADTVLEALRGCRSGRVYALGSPIQRHGIPSVPYRPDPMRLTLINQTDEKALEAFGATGGIGSVEDVLSFGSHAVTHIDALSHIYAEDRIYNGFSKDEATTLGGAARCGIEKAGPMVTRGLLVDVAGHKGVPCLDPGQVVTAADLEEAMTAQGIAPRQGDAVLVRTGWFEAFLADEAGDLAPEQPGLGLEAARLLAAADVALVGADNTAVEAMPFDNGDFVTVHIELLVRRGIHLIEHLRLEELARDGCHEFLFAVAPLPLVGATASPVNPIAIG